MLGIKAVVFDVGNTLLATNPVERWEQTSQLLGIKAGPQPDKLLYKKLEEGKIPFREFLNRVTKRKISGKEFQAVKTLWKKRQANRPIKKVYKIVKRLKANKKYCLGLLSNTDAVHVKENRKQGFFKDFKIQVMSNEAHMLKPSAKIYKMLLKRMKCKPEETLFVDDQRENVTAARKLGIKAILFESPEQLEKKMKKMKVL